MLKKLQSRPWYPYAVALCIGVAFYVILMQLPSIADGLRFFGKYVNTVVVGCIIAYLMNPLAKFYEKKLFVNLQRGRWFASIILAVLTFAVIILLLVLILVPQLISNIASFVEQAPGYQIYIHTLFQKFGITRILYIPETVDEVMDKAVVTLSGYEKDIIAFWTDVFKILTSLAVGLVLAIYLLASKDRLKADFQELLSALMPDDKLETFLSYIRRCDYIVNRYLVFTILDSVIIGLLNAAIMIVLRMPYVGLISIVVGVTNMIPTFGPVIGAVIGGFIILLENPLQAVIFVIANTVLQGLDGYIIKPRLFGNSLGVSGLLILLAIVTLGNIFGMVGLLLAIPFAAICDFTYRDVLLPYLKQRKAQKQSAQISDR